MEPLSSAEGAELLNIAERSIRSGLGGGRHVPHLSELPPRLRRHQGAFVTVLVAGELNGCIGTLYPDDPVAIAVARRAWDAAFADPRLPALRAEDLARSEIEISVLSELEPVPAASEAELIANLRIGVDGLLIAAGMYRATFLPVMWERLSEPAEFLHQLQMKAGLPPGWWPPNMQAARYTAQVFVRSVAGVSAAPSDP
jgi:AmmeMemoRadiSam system protein A